MEVLKALLALILLGSLVFATTYGLQLLSNRRTKKKHDPKNGGGSCCS